MAKTSKSLEKMISESNRYDRKLREIARGIVNDKKASSEKEPSFIVNGVVIGGSAKKDHVRRDPEESLRKIAFSVDRLLRRAEDTKLAKPVGKGWLKCDFKSLGKISFKRGSYGPGSSSWLEVKLNDKKILRTRNFWVTPGLLIDFYDKKVVNANFGKKITKLMTSSHP
jgi:hypothetical protein